MKITEADTRQMITTGQSKTAKLVRMRGNLLKKNKFKEKLKIY